MKLFVNWRKDKKCGTGFSKSRRSIVFLISGYFWHIDEDGYYRLTPTNIHILANHNNLWCSINFMFVFKMIQECVPLLSI